MHRSLGIYVIAKQNPGKDCLLDAMRPVTASNGAFYLQMTLVSLQSTSGEKNKGKRERHLISSFDSLWFLILRSSSPVRVVYVLLLESFFVYLILVKLISH